MVRGRRRTMCPACLTTAALVLAGTTTAGGLTALALKKLRDVGRGTGDGRREESR
jgi:hypothetical protein